MKNLTTVSLAVLAAISLIGCSKSSSPSSESPAGGGKCLLSMNLSGGEHTRATGQTLAKESMIQNIQIFVFNKGGNLDGMLDACKSAGFDTPLKYDASSTPYTGMELECTFGNKEIYAVVNGSTDYVSSGTVLKKETLLANTISLGEGAPDKLFMFGSGSTSLNSGEKKYSITVKRACAGVVLESIKNEMIAPAHQKEGAFKIERVYLTNVPARVRLDFGMDTSYEWYAKLMADNGKRSLIYDEVGKTLNYNKTYDTKHSFYSFPNECAPSTETTWSPRATRLVVEASYNYGTADNPDERLFYYPITLNKGLEANKCYKVNLTIRRPGSSGPEEAVEFGAVSGSISVESWEDGTSYTETI